jgi:hypothetical protein
MLNAAHWREKIGLGGHVSATKLTAVGSLCWHV